jgi:MoaA/NifB/PqqE/SkfB family radical SAM enzyme
MANLTIDINGICNESCKFCYQNLDGCFLPEQTIFEAINKNPDLKTVEIGGGEPFLDFRIIKLIKAICEKKKVHISTNASLIPQGLLDLEESVRQETQIQVSIHGSNSELYQKIHGQDLFEKVVNNTKKIKPRFNTLITSAIYQENFDDVPNLVKLAQTLELPLRVNLVFPIGKGRCIQRLNKQQIEQLRGYLLGQHLSKKGMIDSPLIHTNNCPALEKAYDIEKQGQCPLDYGKVYISPKGEVKGCEFFPDKLVNAKTGAKDGMAK